jgi:hypothetical protein
MTLYMSHNVSGNYVLMTSDTRHVIKDYWFDPVTGEYEDMGLPPRPTDKKAIKTERLSYFTLIGFSGTGELCLYIAEKLKEEIQFDYDIKQCKEALERVIEREKRNKNAPRYTKFLEVEHGLILTLVGFYKEDYTTGMITYNSKDGKVSELKADIGQIMYCMITPAKEYEGHENEILTYPEFADGLEDIEDPLEQQRIMLQRSINHLGTIHNIVSKHHSDIVSPEMEIFYLRLDPKGIDFGRGSHDFAEGKQE